MAVTLLQVLMFAAGVFCHGGIFLLHCVESACRCGDCSGEFCTFHPGAGVVVLEGLSALENVTLSQSQGYFSHIGPYLMIACSGKAD